VSDTNNRVFFTQVHGILHKNSDGSSRQQIIRQCQPGEELVLVPEPTNAYDANAVKICRQNGQQLGYWQADGRLAHDLEIGWTYRVTIDEIYPFKDEPRRQGVRLRVEVLTMGRVTEKRKKLEAGEPNAITHLDPILEFESEPQERKGWFQRLFRIK